MKRSVMVAALALAACAGAAREDAGARQGGVDPRPPNAPSQTPAFAGQTRAPEQVSGVAFEVTTVAERLEHPWAVEFLPDGRMLVTERPGRLRIVRPDGMMSEPVAGLPRVLSTRQGGLLDVALHPDFASNRLIYWSYAEPRNDGTNNTAVARGRLIDGPPPRLENVQVIFRQEPSLDSPLHFGSRLVFARDGTLFVALGDRSIPRGRMQSQQMDSLLGKIVRLNADGSIPEDNPFVGTPGARPEIWSIGHRNVQAATLHPETGELWEVEHGTRGGDELNIVEGGKDYGWPTIAYGIEYRGGPITGGITRHEGMEQPIYYWDPVIAPSGMTFYTGDLFPDWRGDLFIGGLASQVLVRLEVDGDRVTGEERLLEDVGDRIRDVKQGPDGALYVVTDENSGRLLRIAPQGR